MIIIIMIRRTWPISSPGRSDPLIGEHSKRRTWAESSRQIPARNRRRKTTRGGRIEARIGQRRRRWTRRRASTRAESDGVPCSRGRVRRPLRGRRRRRRRPRPLPRHRSIRWRTGTLARRRWRGRGRGMWPQTDTRNQSDALLVVDIVVVVVWLWIWLFHILLWEEGEVPWLTSYNSGQGWR